MMSRTIDQMKSIVVNLRCTQTDHGIEYGREVEDWMYSVSRLPNTLWIRGR